MKLTFAFFVLILMACENKEATPSSNIVFKGSQQVTITGYTDHVMEPFLSRDGNTLMFNNSNEAVNTNLHWAARVNDSTFEYKGEINGVNTASLEGVATMDMNGNLYFVSTRDYNLLLATLYQGNFDNGTVTNLTLVENISKYQAGWVNFDVEVDPSGETLYFVDGRFDQFGGPYEADIVLAKKVNNQFQRLLNSDEMLKNVNTNDLEYAACISADNLELYFTRITAPISASSIPEILVASRLTENEPFGLPSKLNNVTGFVEAATISPDGSKLYYHKRENGIYSLYLTQRVK
jgi:hypothetical protein